MSQRVTVRLGICLAFALAVRAGAQVPEALYYKFNEGSGATTANFAAPGAGANPAPITGLTLTPAGGQFTGGLNGLTSTTGANRVNTGYVANWNASWTISFWLNLNGIVGTTTATVAYPFGDAGTTVRTFVNSTAGSGNIALRGTGVPSLTTTGGVLGTGPKVITLVYNQAASNISCYVNGVLNTSVSGTVAVAGTPQALTVGAYTAGGSPNSLRTGMVMDEFRFYTRALTAGEVAATWNTELSSVGAFANFTGSPTSGGAPRTVNFTDSSTTSEPGGITSWAWDFDNNGTTDSTAQNPSFTYTLPGTYSVRLTVSDGVNPSSNLLRSNYVTVGPYSFDFATTGNGDLTITPGAPNSGMTEGFTLVTHTPVNPIGTGPFFGLAFDDWILAILQQPAFPGSLFHFVQAPGVYPNVPLAFPAGSLSSIAGTTIEGCIVYVINGAIYVSAIDRVTL